MRATSLTCRTSKRRPSSPSNPSVRGQVTSKGFWTRDCPSKLAGGQTTGRSGRTRKSSSYRARRRQSRSFRRGVRITGCHCNLTSNPKHEFLRERKGQGCRRRKRGECLPLLGAGLGFFRSWQTHWPVRRPDEEGGPRIEHYHSARR